MKKNMKTLATIMLMFAAFFFAGCKPEEPNNGNGTTTTVPIVVTSSVTEITVNQAVGNGIVTSDGGSFVIERGLCWSMATEPMVSDNKVVAGVDIGDFSGVLTNLLSDTIYYVRAYAINSIGVGYGDQISFRTLPESVLFVEPSVETLPVTAVTATFASGGGIVIDNGGDAIQERGVCWGIEEYPVYEGFHAEADSEGNEFSCQMNDLMPNTTYYVRAYAKNRVGVGYGEQVSFTTFALDCSNLVLNELNGYDKFIELFNPNPYPISMYGVSLKKDSDEVIWTGSANVAIEANSYLVLYSSIISDHYGILEDLFFQGNLTNKNNVRIQFIDPSGNILDDFNLVDIYQNTPSSINTSSSYSRNLDGNWYYASASPGFTNVEGSAIVYGMEGGPEPPSSWVTYYDYQNLVLNELNGDTKFIELYNKGNRDLPLESLYLMKDDKEEPVWIGKADVVIPAHDYLTLYSNDVMEEHPELTESFFFWCGISSKKTIRFALDMPDEVERDVFTRGTTGHWGEAVSNVAPLSYARTPDGGEWRLANPTPGTANPSYGDPIPQE